MPKFSYTARDKEANFITGEIDSKDSSFVVRELKNKNLTIISIVEKKEEKKSVAKSGKRRVRSMELVIFSRQLATLIDSGVSLIAGLTILHDQVENPYLKKVVFNIKSDIEAGNSLSSSFAKYPDTFPEIFMNMIRAGESSGSLNVILERVAEYLERTENIMRKLKGAFTYPCLVVGMAIIIVAFLIIKVVPTFKSIFDSMGGDLPMPTLILIKISEYSGRYFVFIVGGVIAAYISFDRYIHTNQGRLRFDQFKFNIPVLGTIFKSVAVSKFTRTLAILAKSGVNILESFEIAGKVAGNKVIELATDQIRADLQAGESIAEPMAKTGKFSVFVVKMVAVGEQTGELEKMLSKVSDYYEEQINETLANLNSMLEPLIIVSLGLIIGFIVLAMFLPIFKLTQAIGK